MMTNDIRFKFIDLYKDVEINETKLDNFKKISVRTDYHTYRECVRALYLRQGFWKNCILETPKKDKEGHALVIENGFGGCAISLTEDFERVTSICYIPELFQIYRKRKQSDPLFKLIDVIRVNIAHVLPFKSHRFRTIVLYNVFSDLGSNKNYFALLNECKRVLRIDGTIIIVEKNAADIFELGQSFVNREKNKLPAIAYSKIEKHLKKLELRYQTNFVSRNSFGLDLEPLPELITIDGKREGYFTNKKIVNYKEHILFHKIIKKRWPSFVIAASSEKHVPEVIDIAIANTSELNRHTKNNSLIIKRICAGNDNVNIVICGNIDEGNNDIVIRMPMTEAGLRRCENNHRAILELKPALQDLLPKALYTGQFRKQPIFIEEKKAGGVILEFNDRLLNMIDKAACDWIKFQKSKAKRITLDVERYDKKIGKHFLGIAKYCKPDLRQQILKLEYAVKKNFCGQTMLLVPSHGDFKPSNILFSEAGEVIGIIDWDNYAKNGLPLIDVFTLITYFESELSNLPINETYINVILEEKQFYNLSLRINECMKYFELDNEKIRCLRVLFWFVNWNARSNPEDMIHQEWQKNIIRSVLPAMNQLMGVS